MSKKDIEHNEESSKKLDKTKKFIKKYWLPITVGVVCTTVTYVVTRRVTLHRLAILEGTSIDFFNKPTHDLVEVTVPKAVNRIAGSGVYNPDTRVGYFSQQAAARAYGVSESDLSKHLYDAHPHVRGEILKRVTFRIFAEVEK